MLHLKKHIFYVYKWSNMFVVIENYWILVFTPIINIIRRPEKHFIFTLFVSMQILHAEFSVIRVWWWFNFQTIHLLRHFSFDWWSLSVSWPGKLDQLMFTNIVLAPAPRLRDIKPLNHAIWTRTTFTSNAIWIWRYQIRMFKSWILNKNCILID